MSDRGLLIFIAIYAGIEMFTWVINLIGAIIDGIKEGRDKAVTKIKPKTFQELLDEKMKDMPERPRRNKNV